MIYEAYWSVALSNKSFPGFRMSILWDCLLMVRILFHMKYLSSIARSHLLALGSKFYSCSTKTSSLPAAFLSLVMLLLSCILPC